MLTDIEGNFCFVKDSFYNNITIVIEPLCKTCGQTTDRYRVKSAIISNRSKIKLDVTNLLNVYEYEKSSPESVVATCIPMITDLLADFIKLLNCRSNS